MHIGKFRHTAHPRNGGHEGEIEMPLMRADDRDFSVSWVEASVEWS